MSIISRKILHHTLLISEICTLILSICCHTVFAQLINTDQAPPSVKWNQINEDAFNLIYPTELYEEAQRTANILKNKVQYLSSELGIKPRKINIILQNRNVEGNGYVQLAPRKSEFYTTSPQKSDPSDWVQNLAIHEYRHVVQIDKLTGNIHFPFEELGFAFFGIALPPWFYEGDAVLTETLYGSGGRGQIPSWEINLRANILEGKKYGYQKNYLGSFKDITPGYYQLGYFLATKLRRDYGENITDSLLSRIANNPTRLYNFSQSLKKLTGFTSKEWHTQTLSELSDLWQRQQTRLQPKIYPTISPVKGDFPVAFNHPQLDDQGHLLAIEQTPEKVNAIVEIKSDGAIKELIKTGRQSTPYFSHAAGKLTWNEVQVDGRFKLRSYSVIHVYNIATESLIQLTKKSRFFSPDLNADATKIAVAEIDLGNKNSLVILDAETGEETLRIPSPQNRMLSSVSFEENNKVLAVTRTSSGTGIIEFSLADKSSRMLIDTQVQEIESPNYAGNKIIFKAHYNGIDNIYSLNPLSSEITQLTNAKYGAYDPYFDPKTNQIYFTNYDGRNYTISHIAIENISNIPLSKINNTFISYFKPLQEKKDNELTNDNIPQEIFPQKPYKEANNLFNFHSLSINDGNYDNLENYKPGLFLLSNNLMNTIAAKIGATYDPDQHGLNYHAEIQYNRYFPKITIAYNNRSQLSNIRNPEDSKLYAVRWRENYTQFQVELPFSYNRLNQNYSIKLQIASSYINRYQFDNALFDKILIKHVEFPMHYQLSLGRNTRYSTLDLAPKWGQNISIGYSDFPFSDLNGSRYYLQSALYFPGILPNHSSQLRFNYQHGEGIFANSNVIQMVSGYDQLQLTQPTNTFFINYKFPFAYPDFEIGSLAYIKRLKAILFADYEDIGINGSFQPRTFGAEVRADMNLFRFFLPNFDLGVKAIYINENNPKRFIFQYSLRYSY